MSSEGVGDGAGVSVDLSVRFFSALTGWPLEPGAFGVANLFMPTDPAYEPQAARDRPRGAGTTGPGGPARTLSAGRPERPAPGRRGLPAADRAVGLRRPGRPRPEPTSTGPPTPPCWRSSRARYERPELAGLYPLSLSARTQVLKGRLNAGEVVRYFTDLVDPRHEVRTLYFHTRFSTNTEPHPTMAQPFRMMAHNGELNTDRKNRLADDAARPCPAAPDRPPARPVRQQPPGPDPAEPGLRRRAGHRRGRGLDDAAGLGERPDVCPPEVRAMLGVLLACTRRRTTARPR